MELSCDRYMAGANIPTKHMIAPNLLILLGGRYKDIPCAQTP
jgi:hypothetical protein